MKTHIKTLLPALALIGSATAVPAFGATITYVDTSAGNTTVNGSTMVIEPAGGANVDDDDVNAGVHDWTQRDPFANSGNVFQTGTSGGTGDDVLNTTVSGLTSGTYRVYAYFWDSSAQAGNDWDLAAQLNAGGFQDKTSTSPGVVAASTQTFTAAVVTTSGNLTMYAIDLSTFTGTGFTVNARGGSASTAIDPRTWYDGVGYELVPEPSSLALLAMGGLCLLRRRRA